MRDCKRDAVQTGADIRYPRAAWHGPAYLGLSPGAFVRSAVGPTTRGNYCVTWTMGRLRAGWQSRTWESLVPGDDSNHGSWLAIGLTRSAPLVQVASHRIAPHSSITWSRGPHYVQSREVRGSALPRFCLSPRSIQEHASVRHRPVRPASRRLR